MRSTAISRFPHSSGASGHIPVGRGGYQDHPAFQGDGGINYADGVMRPGYREEWQAFAAAIRTGAECHANVEDAWQAMRIVEALAESLRIGDPVTIPAQCGTIAANG